MMNKVLLVIVVFSLIAFSSGVLMADREDVRRQMELLKERGFTKGTYVSSNQLAKFLPYDDLTKTIKPTGTLLRVSNDSDIFVFGLGKDTGVVGLQWKEDVAVTVKFIPMPSGNYGASTDIEYGLLNAIEQGRIIRFIGESCIQIVDPKLQRQNEDVLCYSFGKNAALWRDPKSGILMWQDILVSRELGKSTNKQGGRDGK